MIKYDLICQDDHMFEVWFSSMSDYDRQVEQSLVNCPYCQTTQVEKAIMAPAVSTSRKKDAISQSQITAQSQAMAMMNKAANEIKEKIEKECDYVGDKFADEARAMHYGEKEERAIYGKATPKDALALSDEGIGVAPLPDIIAPKPKSDLN